MDLKQIKQIIDLMKRSELTEFAVEEEGFKLKIRRGANGLPIVSTGRGSNPPFAPDRSERLNSPMPAPVPPLQSTVEASTAPSEPRNLASPTSSRPWSEHSIGRLSPESKAFVDVGAKIDENTVVCIIEAMKIMNEIQAETKGTVVEILVENGQPVEYGQRLFKVKQG